MFSTIPCSGRCERTWDLDVSRHPDTFRVTVLQDTGRHISSSNVQVTGQIESRSAHLEREALCDIGVPSLLFALPVATCFYQRVQTAYWRGSPGDGIAPRPPGPRQSLVFYTSQCSAIALGERECVVYWCSFSNPQSSTFTALGTPAGPRATRPATGRL